MSCIVGNYWKIKAVKIEVEGLIPNRRTLYVTETEGRTDVCLKKFQYNKDVTKKREKKEILLLLQTTFSYFGLPAS